MHLLVSSAAFCLEWSYIKSKFMEISQKSKNFGLVLKEDIMLIRWENFVRTKINICSSKENVPTC